ncbi:MAG: hypothetical protein FWD87_05025 [Spirochaetaceae bacterium]|nr:hypothetical protein [Spirochaetaceae bacterium]
MSNIFGSPSDFFTPYTKMTTGILEDFLYMARICTLKEVCDTNKTYNKILKEISSYDILLIYLNEIDNHCVNIECFLEESKGNDFLKNTAESYFHTVYSIHKAAVDNILTNIKSIYEEYLLKLGKEWVLGFLKVKNSDLEYVYKKSINSYSTKTGIQHPYLIDILNNTYKVIELFKSYIAFLEGNGAMPSEAIQANNNESLPELNALNELTEGNNPILRKWIGGKYKCGSLPVFVKEYRKKAQNLTLALINDYLISEKTGKPYKRSVIVKDIQAR